MKILKITNITDTLGKRDDNFNKELFVDYVDKMEKKKLVLRPKKTVFLSIPSTPLSLSNLMMKGLVIVDEVSSKEMRNILNKEKAEKKEMLRKIEEKKKAAEVKPKKTTSSKQQKKSKPETEE